MKSPMLYGFRLGLESTYGQGGTALGNNDYIMPMDPTIPTLEYANDGSRGLDARSAGTLRRVKPSMSAMNVDLKIPVRGFSGAIDPEAPSAGGEIHNLLRIAGHAAEWDTDKWVYTPATRGFPSAYVDALALEQTYNLAGVVAKSFTLEGEAGGLVTAAFSLRGIPRVGAGSVISDAPAEDEWGGDYDQSISPNRFEGGSLDLNSVSGLVCRKFSLKMERETTDRPTGTGSASLAGVAMGRRTCTLDLTVEAVSLAVLSPFALQSAATPVAITLVTGQNGPTQNPLTVSTVTAQLVSVTENADGAVTTWDLSFALSTGNILEGAIDSDYTLTIGRGSL